jgi:hypothetical protein
MAWSLPARIGTATQRYTCFNNIHSVGSTFIASVAVDVFETYGECLVVRAQCLPSYQVASSLVTTVPLLQLREVKFPQYLEQSVSSSSSHKLQAHAENWDSASSWVPATAESSLSRGSAGLPRAMLFRLSITTDQYRCRSHRTNNKRLVSGLGLPFVLLALPILNSI